MNRGNQHHNSDFTCKHCGRYVSSNAMLAGVNNRNHCPYCLWSRHLDLRQAGDRLSACKAGMKPVGLTMKASHKKYGSGRGELMLVHACTECGKLSLNRIAADDDPDLLLRLIDYPQPVEPRTEDISLLSSMEREVVVHQLFGTM